ncbi:MAG: transcriptional regulator [Candidatus Schekmanbacteria bacterium RBG_13_48_7]|uniref:Transcriptional regulator n=1 Tax=Candidatus Schekmanbacteria bacterium RBG_13_48_7 TaxID=1817878 RepID=A0A1F7RQN5_9BACT|nr:MAG: transcriptional regulator [Candidatus Schekmanbacteria bacterium RBG_13_48_7]
MDAMTKTRYQARAKIMKALAHPTRLFIVEELSNETKCVGELTEMVGADVSTVSKHLSILKNAGLVSDDKQGTQIYYTLRCLCVVNFFSCIESVIREVTKEQIDILG